MNRFVPSGFSERVTELALGLELIDAVRGGRVGPDMRVAFDETARGLPRPKLLRHNSGLHTLVASPELRPDITLRVFDAGRKRRRDPDLVVYDPRFDRRRFVPRRFTIPLPLEQDWDEPWDDGRGRRPHLFPGAAYDVTDTATGLRGRIETTQKPLRWVRVEARVAGTADVVAWAHGDDRGEFLLLLPRLAAPLGDPDDPLEYDLAIYGPDPIPVPTAALTEDPLWDLPVERFGDPGTDDDPVERGEQVPNGYVSVAADSIAFEPGRTIYRLFTVV